MSRQDLTNAYRWSLEEGWNIGAYDHDVFYASDPDGFFIGELNGEPVGCVSGVAYGSSFGFVGIYIVQPEFRGLGYGIQIFNEAMAYLDGRCVGLDGVLAQQDNYRRSGFELAFRNIRYEWTPPVGSVDETGLADARTLPFELLADYDALHFPERREAFLKPFIHEPEALPLAHIDAVTGKITGFAMLRRSTEGWSFGPLFANSQEIADKLFLALSSTRPGERVFLDVPAVNSAAIALAADHGMTQVFETARMYRGPAPQLPWHNIYGITSFELG